VDPSRTIAIVLHGPPGVGKSTICEHIRQAHPTARRICLDNGWGVGPNELRTNGGPARYADLRGAAEDVLLVEIAGGEPADPAILGATRNAREWVDVLRAAGRDIIPILLTVERTEAEARITRRYQGVQLAAIRHEVGIHDLYARKDPKFTFPPTAGLRESCVSTTGRSAGDVAAEIVRLAGLVS
jgi:hypothetical protein